MSKREVSDPESFVRWFRDNSDRLRTLPSEDAADEIGTKLVAVDSRLGVEVAENEPNTDREIILTAFSDLSAFPVVRRIVDELADPVGWVVVGLKPERGFDFKIDAEGTSLDVGELAFVIVSDVNHAIGIVVSKDVSRVLPSGQEAEELAWLIVETGLGEEVAAQVNSIEFIVGSRDDARPLAEMALRLRRCWGH